VDQGKWIGAGGGLLVGLVIGYFVGSRRTSEPAVIPTSAPPVSSPAPAWIPGFSEIQKMIFSAQQAVEKDPNNLQAWIALGNGYFDTHQAQKAIEAYGKALELDPRNANVLTDQGIMFREIKAFDKAIANFEQANKIDPKHLQSLYNLGIVYANDMNSADKAVKVWRRVIASDPASPQADLSRKALEELKTKP